MISMKVDGVKQLQDELNALGVELGVKILASAARKAFLPVLAAAQAKAPVDTGLLRDSIRIQVKKPKDGDEVVVVGLKVAKATLEQAAKTKLSARGLDERSPHWRWHFIELGTAYQAARPFLRPALDENAEAVLTDLRDELRKGIDRALRRRARRK